jgi:hypothetical protein
MNTLRRFEEETRENEEEMRGYKYNRYCRLIDSGDRKGKETSAF